MNQSRYLPGDRLRGRWMRLDTAGILKRFFYLERALIISQAAWLVRIPSFDVKTALPHLLWQDAMTAHALRERVFELRYPNRLMEVGVDAPLVELFAESINAPNAAAFVLALAKVYKPALADAYARYLAGVDQLADGPTIRFLALAAREKGEQEEKLQQFAVEMLRESPGQQATAETWVAALEVQVQKVGGVGLVVPQASGEQWRPPGHTPFVLPDVPARDPRFHLCRYYWPDIIVPDFPYGEGLLLQLRSAISHFNEVWAVETAGAILHAFADALEWEFIHDAARWTYDEARHARMGYDRLRQWGFETKEMPLGSYIYDSGRGQDPIVRLGMLHYFETKNIGKKTARAQAFAGYADRVSQHDMDFDWADETIHAHYGRHWHETLREKYPDRIPDVGTLHRHCDALVANEVATATDEERQEILAVAEALIQKARKLVRA